MPKPTQRLPETGIELVPRQTSQCRASQVACPSPPSFGEQVLPRTHAGSLQESRASVRRAVVSLFLWTRLASEVSFKFLSRRDAPTITISRRPHIPIQQTICNY